MALSADRITPRKEGLNVAYPVKSATTIYKGALVMLDSTGYLVEASAGGGTFVGVAMEGCVNPSGGALTVRVYKTGVFKFAKTGSIAQANVGAPLKISDDETLALMAAYYQTNLSGATNNDLLFTAKAPWLGLRGEDITLEYVDPGGTTATLTVTVNGTHIKVSLGRTASAIDTTGALLKAAIEAHSLANAMVSVAHATGNDGTGLVAALSPVRLSAGDYCGDLEALDGSAVLVRIDKAVA